jgi:hypothetical protein
MIEKVFCRREGRKRREEKNSARLRGLAFTFTKKGWQCFFLFVVLLVSLKIIRILLGRVLRRVFVIDVSFFCDEV